jgi:hypothetical protein
VQERIHMLWRPRYLHHASACRVWLIVLIFISWRLQVNQNAKVSVKLVAEAGIGVVASGVAKANADIIQVCCVGVWCRGCWCVWGCVCRGW